MYFCFYIGFCELLWQYSLDQFVWIPAQAVGYQHLYTT
jgi:hypothetical protein